MSSIAEVAAALFFVFEQYNLVLVQLRNRQTYRTFATNGETKLSRIFEQPDRLQWLGGLESHFDVSHRDWRMNRVFPLA